MMNGKIRSAVFVLLAGLLVTVLQANAAEASSLVAERPGPEGEPTQVKLGIFLIDIDEINDVDQRFSVDLFFRLRWNDPRLALPEGDQGIGLRTFSLDDIWTPKALIVNDRGLNTQLPRVAEVDTQGNVQYRQRLYGELAVSLDLHEFPFDSQILPIDIISYAYDPGQLQFLADGEMGGNIGAFAAEGWRFKALEPQIGEFSVTGTDWARSRITYGLEARRISQYYVLTIFLPITLIVFMAWSAFWLQPNIVPSRIAISTASIFSLLAFGFSIRMSLPKIAYVTRADMFAVGCMLMVFLALAVAVLGSRWAEAGEIEKAKRLNGRARWVYVGLYVLVAVVALA
jgi:hypothetical protein